MSTDTKFYLGVDVSKPYFDVALMAVVGQQKQPVVTARFGNTAEGLKGFRLFLKGHGVSFDANSMLVMENTGVYNRLIWGFCGRHGLPVYIGNAAHIKWSFGLVRGKSDIIDAKRLCAYARKHADEITASCALDPVFIKLKDLMAARAKLIRQRGAIVGYLKELSLFSDKDMQAIMKKTHKAALAGLKASIAEIEKQIAAIVSEPAIAPNYALIKSVPGIGQWTALYIIACTNNFAGGVSGKQLASYAGVVPFGHSSGTSVRGRNRVHQMANKELKRMLHLCAISAIKHYAEFRDYFDRKKNEGKHAMAVLNAIRNKLVLRVVAVVKNQKSYVNNHAQAV